MATQHRSFIETLWDFFCSLRLTLFTLILLAITSVIGTVIPQNQTDAQYLQTYSEKVVRLFKALDFFDMYDSWWFVLLLALMTLNLVCCSINRFPRAWKVVRQPVLIPSEGLMNSLSNREEFLSEIGPEAVREKLVPLLERRLARVAVTEADGKTYLFSQKGGFGRFGAYVVHLSIIVILIGAIMGMVWGTKAFVNIPEGGETMVAYERDTQQPIPLGFTVRCDDFDVTFYQNSRMPKEYRSLLTVVKDGRVVDGLKQVPVIVNAPLTFEGWTFYQSSYGPAGEPEYTLTVRNRATGEETTAAVQLGQRTELPGGGGVFRALPAPDSMARFGLGVAIQVLSMDKPSRPPFMVFQAHPDFDEKRGGNYVFKLTGMEQPQFTGLEVAKDPGVPVVWLGCALMILGCFTAFFLSHRRLWVVIEAVGNKTGITLGGSAHRNQPGFELFFEDLTRDFRQSLGSPAVEVEEA